MAQGKKAAAGGKSAAKKVASRVKSVVGAVKKKVAPKKPAAPAKAAAKPAGKAKPAAKPKPAAKKPAPKPGKKSPVKPSKTVAKPKAAAKAIARVVAKPVRTAAKATAKAVKSAVATVKPAKKAAVPKEAVELKKPARALPKAVSNKPPEKPVAPATPPVPPPAAAAPKPAPPAEEKGKRGRRARPRVTSNGAPAASWLTSEKPRAASFIPAPPRAEAPSAIAAPPASSDRLLRDDDVIDLAVRTVPVRVDVEQGAGRFYVHASPQEVSLKAGEGIEWDFRYLGGADVMCDEIIVEFEKPAPFAQHVFRTRKPGGARPHRALSGPASATAAGQRIQYTVRAMTAFKTELASSRVWMNVTA